MHHELKILPEYFDAVMDGRKTFEIRLDDRGYKEGDTVTLSEHDPAHGFTGRQYNAAIGWVTYYEQKPNYVVFSLVPNVKVTGAAPGKETNHA